MWKWSEDEDAVARRKAAIDEVKRETAARKEARAAERAAQRQAEALRRAQAEQREAERKRKQDQEEAEAAAAEVARARAAAHVQARQDAVEERKRQNRELSAAIRAQHDAERAERRRLEAQRRPRPNSIAQRSGAEVHGGESVSDLVPMMYKHKLTQRYTGISDDFTATGGHLITLCGIRVGLRDDPMPDRATECSACLFAEQMRDADM